MAAPSLRSMPRNVTDVTRTLVAAAAFVAATAYASTMVIATADPTVAGDAFDANEIAYLNDVHRYAAAQGLTGDDESLVQDGYYACHLQKLSGPGGGPPPEAFGISPMITYYAIQHFCPEVR